MKAQNRKLLEMTTAALFNLLHYEHAIIEPQGSWCE